MSGEDVLDMPRSGKCPRCGAILSPPETTYDDTGVELLDGPTSWWCPACGWESE